MPQSAFAERPPSRAHSNSGRPSCALNQRSAYAGRDKIHRRAKIEAVAAADTCNAFHLANAAQLERSSGKSARQRESAGRNNKGICRETACLLNETRGAIGAELQQR
ncbi:hypothetical protein HPB50_018034 [Hyalomma asiaticum]|uniref:Uncharacterized protein n=1 Tax=Hyalomma asiaticum TaxID=266040 RepID=A0ACB7SAE5_HYAAI|nr:hypothetical protein HPB50_018034 [Hyalomma asiaticum]